MTKPKVFLTGGDNQGWALDTDLKLTKETLTNIVDFSDLENCEVIHSMWWEALNKLPQSIVEQKKIICHFPGEPFRYLKDIRHRKMFSIVDQWIVQSKEAQKELDSIGYRSNLIPYTVDLNIFKLLNNHNQELNHIKQQLNIPKDFYIIGNFHRDTEGYDLKSPKLMKGPDIFIEIIKELVKRQNKVHVLLAGPRRFWVIKQLELLSIPYTYYGQKLEENQDDIRINNLSLETINILYNIIDLYIVSSRTEGGPRSILETASSKCKIVSTSVGIAQDILTEECIYHDPLKAVELIEKDIKENFLIKTVEKHFECVTSLHSSKSNKSLLERLYNNLEKAKINNNITQNYKKKDINNNNNCFLYQKILNKLDCISQKKFKVSLWHEFKKPPYGGGNQFMLALEKGLIAQKIKVKHNTLNTNIDVHVLNSIHFDVKRFLKIKNQSQLSVLHRIDGPISLIRGFDREKDELCFKLNKEFASATVLQSTWVYQKIVEMGYQPVNPVIISNAVNPDIFYPKECIGFNPERKIRLISTSWSSNPRKGGAIYKWIENHLDWNKFEYTFVGNASEKFERIHQIAPVNSQELAKILRAHDIYITASKNDPCSNALIEALSCGLPVLYLNSGGHSELVSYGGLPFNDIDEIFPQLNKLVENYEIFQKLITISTLKDISEKYLNLLKDITN